MYKNIRLGIEEKYRSELNEALLKINESEEGFKWLLNFHGKQYKGDLEQQRTKFKRFLVKYYNTQKANDLEHIKQIEEADYLKGDLIITVEWKKSYMWGMNPKAFDNYGHESESITGCGYCKLSTATAQVLNQNLPLLKRMFDLIEYSFIIGTDLKKVFPYGTGHNELLPSFAVGVGVSSHENILNAIGYNMRNITSTSNTDVYLITKKVEE